MKDTTDIQCGFCGKYLLLGQFFLKGVGATICTDCISLSNQIQKNITKKNTTKEVDSPNPMKIIEDLNKSIIGQDEAKEQIALSVYTHFQKIKNPDLVIEKSNLLLVGPTGSGKTLIVDYLSEILNEHDSRFSFISADGSSYTQSGYKGPEVDEIIENLYIHSGEDKEATEAGVIFIDEIDKITDSHDSWDRGRGVQDSFLKLIEGKTVRLENFDILIDTSKILFIFAGAFNGLEDILRKRTFDSSIGITAKIKDKNDVVSLKNDIKSEDFIKFGLVAEFLGRINSIVFLDKLNKDQLVEILKDSDRSITKHYESLFWLEGKSLQFDDDVYGIIADQALDLKIGARGLRRVVDKSLKNLFLQTAISPGKKETIKVNKKFFIK